jgi:hypothetical protein
VRQVLLEGRAVPCNRNKKPLIEDWQNRASSDLAQQAAWEDEFPGCLWGILCGITFDVVDVDPKGLWWALEHEAELKTYTQVTRRRGLHLYFQPTPGLHPKTGCPVEGVDVRATGSIVIDWKRKGFPTIERSMLPMPGWLVEAALKPTKQINKPPPAPLMTGAKASELPRELYFKAQELTSSRRDKRRVCGILSVVVFANEGCRNNRLFWAACRFAEFIREGWFQRVDAERLLMTSAMLCGLEGQEATATIRSGLSH